MTPLLAIDRVPSARLVSGDDGLTEPERDEVVANYRATIGSRTLKPAALAALRARRVARGER